jgi:hypothetical protein
MGEEFAEYKIFDPAMRDGQFTLICYHGNGNYRRDPL